ncbi:MAG: hypothetical protein CMM87_02475 [Rickettsiales bacterium]|mgnify:CR=1 FL=1|nr:hypothetical protein [Rickettsiales bacterium]|tara:strand:+ start:5924 stop:7219 length:1296 start_codon:yes stop_codon:yes gene_type:complete
MIKKLTLLSLVLFTSIINSAPPEPPFDPDQVTKIGLALESHFKSLAPDDAQAFLLAPLNIKYVEQFAKSTVEKILVSNPEDEGPPVYDLAHKAPDGFNFEQFLIGSALQTTDTDKKLGYPKLTPFSFAILKGDKDLISLFRSKLTPEQLNSKEARVWGFRQPFSPVHLAVDPQYPFPLARHERKVWEENVINLAAHGADLNFQTNHSPDSCYDYSPLDQVYGSQIGHGAKHYLSETPREHNNNKARMQALLIILGAKIDAEKLFPKEKEFVSTKTSKVAKEAEERQYKEQVERTKSVRIATGVYARQKALIEFFDRLYTDPNLRSLIKLDTSTKDSTGKTVAENLLDMLVARKNKKIEDRNIENQGLVTHLLPLLSNTDPIKRDQILGLLNKGKEENIKALEAKLDEQIGFVKRLIPNTTEEATGAAGAAS